MLKTASTNLSFPDLLGLYLGKADIYAAKALADASAAIIRKRLELGMSQKEFAEHMGVSQGMVSKWESGDYNFSIETLADVCERLGLAFTIDIVPEDSYVAKTDWGKTHSIFNWNGQCYSSLSDELSMAS